jgi:hypothetical protein
MGSILSYKVMRQFLAYNFVLTLVSFGFAYWLDKNGSLWSVLLAIAAAYFFSNLGYALGVWKIFQVLEKSRRIYLRSEKSGTFPRWYCGFNAEILTADGRLVSIETTNEKPYYARGLFAKHRAFLFAMANGYLALL